MRSVIREISKDEDRYKRDKGIIEMRLMQEEVNIKMRYEIRVITIIEKRGI